MNVRLDRPTDTANPSFKRLSPTPFHPSDYEEMGSIRQAEHQLELTGHQRAVDGASGIRLRLSEKCTCFIHA